MQARQTPTRGFGSVPRALSDRELTCHTDLMNKLDWSSRMSVKTSCRTLRNSMLKRNDRIVSRICAKLLKKKARARRRSGAQSSRTDARPLPMPRGIGTTLRVRSESVPSNRYSG